MNKLRIIFVILTVWMPQCVGMLQSSVARFSVSARGKIMQDIAVHLLNVKNLITEIPENNSAQKAAVSTKAERQLRCAAHITHECNEIEKCIPEATKLPDNWGLDRLIFSVLDKFSPTFGRECTVQTVNDACDLFFNSVVIGNEQ